MPRPSYSPPRKPGRAKSRGQKTWGGTTTKVKKDVNGITVSRQQQDRDPKLKRKKKRDMACPHGKAGTKTEGAQGGDSGGGAGAGVRTDPQSHQTKDQCKGVNGSILSSSSRADHHGITKTRSDSAPSGEEPMGGTSKTRKVVT